MDSIKFLAFFSTILISSTLSAEIGIAPHITAGQHADIREFPFAISVQQSRIHLCVASLISEKFALSSARCMSNRLVSNLVVEFGNTVINPGVRDGPHNVGISRIIFHPSFNITTLENDICIIELAREINLDAFYEPFAHLATVGSRFASGTAAIHAGWGYTGPSTNTTQLYRGDVTVLTHAECIEAVGDTRQPFFQNICAVGESVICNGDMGIPLLVNRILVGIASFRSGEVCVPNELPNVYTAVSFYVSWIESVTDLRFNVNTFLSRN